MQSNYGARIGRMWRRQPLLARDEAWAQQQDLDALCRDRVLQTSELLSANDYYGNAEMVKRYVGLPALYPLKAVIPHGVALSATWVWQAEVNSRLPVYFSYCRNRRRALSQHGFAAIVDFVHPFLLALELLRHQAPKARRGTIVFRKHSTHMLDMVVDDELLVGQLERIPSDRQPVTVCLYWKDVLRGVQRVYQRRGIPVVSAGHIFDSMFLPRLVHLLSSFAHAASAEVGTHVFLAIAAGCHFHLLDPVPVAVRGAEPKEDTLPPAATLSPERKRLLRMLTSSRADQRTVTGEHIGEVGPWGRYEVLAKLFLAESLFRPYRCVKRGERLLSRSGRIVRRVLDLATSKTG
ncbi:hypothetical protein ACFL59_12175 [Planctomycetota bacterium]